MATKRREELYAMFSTGSKPNQDDFVDLIDSAINIEEDGIGSSQPGLPIEFVAQGELHPRYMDLSSKKDEPDFRFSAKGKVSGTTGLDITTSETSRIFIEKDKGLIGIANDDPDALLHIKPGPVDTVVQVNDATNSDTYPAFFVNKSGEVGIGTSATNSNRLSVEGSTQLTGQTSITGSLSVSNGLTVSGSTLNAQKGITFSDQSIVQSGTLTIDQTSTLNVAGTLDISNGANLSSGELSIADTASLVVNGLLTVNKGAAINGQDLLVEKSVTVGGSLTIDDGATINGSEFSVGSLTNIDGTLNANNGATISGQGLVVEQGAMIKAGATDDGIAVTISGGKLLAQDGIQIVGGDLVSDVNAKFDGGNGLIISKGELQAQAGATISGGLLNAEDGVVISSVSGLIVDEGEVKANAGATVGGVSGLRITEGFLSADGGATIGGTSGLTITQGELVAKNGASIQGEIFKAEKGATVSGDAFKAEDSAFIYKSFHAPDTVTLGMTTVTSLDVTGDFSAKTLNLESIDLVNLNAGRATISELQTESEFEIGGELIANSNVYFGGERLLVIYEGLAGQEATVSMVRETGTIAKGTGHFNISIDNFDLLIAYNEESDIDVLISDWNEFKQSNMLVASGFQMYRVGSNPWTFKDATEKLSPSPNIFKEYKLSSNGLRIIYAGADISNPKFRIETNTKEGVEQFDFAVVDDTLVIKSPFNELDRTAGSLMDGWISWKYVKSFSAKGFEILQITDQGKITSNVSGGTFTLTGDVFRQCSFDQLFIRHKGRSDASEMPRVIMKSATQNGESGVVFTTEVNMLEIRLGIVDNSPQAVSNAWSSYLNANGISWDFEIVDSLISEAINLIQTETLELIDVAVDTASQTSLAGYTITYNGPQANLAQLKTQVSNDNSFKFTADDVTKLLTIYYPISVSARTVSGLHQAWSNFNGDKHGFEIVVNNSSTNDDFYVEWSVEMNPTPEEVNREYRYNSSGADGITVLHTGHPTLTPAINIQSQPAGNNSFSFDANQANRSLTIFYPADKSGTVDTLLLAWEGYEPKSDFQILKVDAQDSLVISQSRSLSNNSGSLYFSSGGIRTNTVTVNGYLKFGDSGITLKGTSDDSTFQESSSRLLPTQNAVKKYADTKALKNGETDQNFTAADLAVHNDFSLKNGHKINEITNSTLFENPSQTAVATEYAIKALADTKAQREGHSGQDFSTHDLTIAGTFGFDGSSIEKFILTEPDPAEVINETRAFPSVSYMKSYAASLDGDVGQDFGTKNLQVSGTFSFDGSTIENILLAEPDPADTVNQDTALPNVTYMKEYAAQKAGNATQDFSTQNIRIYRNLSFDGTTNIDKVLVTDPDPASGIDEDTALPNVTFMKSYAAALAGSDTQDFRAQDLRIYRNLSFDGTTNIDKILVAEPDPASGINEDTALPNVSYMKDYATPLGGKDTQDFLTKNLVVKGDFGFDETIVFSRISTDISSETIDDGGIPSAKAVKSYVDSTADNTPIIAQLAGKADIVVPNPSSSSVAEGAEKGISDFIFTANSTGMLMITVIDSADIVSSGLFAVQGTSIVSKISGGQFSDQKSGSDFNLYYSAITSTLTFQNNAIGSGSVTMHITYFGVL
ncbi:MAG: hypothetical protein MJE63_03550 [Proteobacteria bacterium]|nr:hypothetical protein [Pseudomonadota bacterium]